MTTSLPDSSVIGDEGLGDHDFNPHGFYVYFLWGENAEIPLYVGRSAHVFARIGQHMYNHSLATQVRRVTIREYPSRELMEWWEDLMIRYFQPPWNGLYKTRKLVSELW